MYVHYKLRKPKGLIIPRGPNFSHASTISCNIDGTSLSFIAPKHRPQHKNHKQIVPSQSLKIDEMIFRSNFDEKIKVSDDWKTFNLFHRTWAFYGSWFTGTLAELRMDCTLVKPVKYETNDLSLFHPRAFENIVADYLTNQFSKYKNKISNRKHHYIAPVNWQPLNDLPVVEVRLQVLPDESVVSRTSRHFVFFPIDNQIMACIQFIPSQLKAATQKELDEQVSRETMYELMDNIIASIELSLSPEAEAQQKAAVEGLDDTSLVKEFLPLKWDNLNPEVSQKKVEKK